MVNPQPRQFCGTVPRKFRGKPNPLFHPLQEQVLFQIEQCKTRVSTEELEPSYDKTVEEGSGANTAQPL